MSDIFTHLWEDYVTLNPSAQHIHNLLTEQGEKITNDHVAFRTFRSKRFGIESLAQHFKKIGYKEMGEYHFEEKKLYAKHYETAQVDAPKVFISELKTEECSPFLQMEVERLIAMAPDGIEDKENFPYCGRPWEVSHEVYQKLLDESEYAAWLSAFGFRANHFTVLVNRLNKYNDLEKLNRFIEENGYHLNESGGRIKGSKEVLLEQSSTQAVSVPVEFSDGTYVIPACYYEFAKRYDQPDGILYQGFVAASADKIFESTDRAKK